MLSLALKTSDILPKTKKMVAPPVYQIRQIEYLGSQVFSMISSVLIAGFHKQFPLVKRSN
jgi:hypothetical protein